MIPRSRTSDREGMSLCNKKMLTLKGWLTKTAVDEIYSALRKLGFPLAALSAMQEALEFN